MRPLQVAVFVCTWLYSAVQSTVVQYLYFKPKMSRSKHKSNSDIAGIGMMREKELLPRHHWISFSRGSIELNPARKRYLCYQRQVSETAACPPSPFSGSLSAPPFLCLLSFLLASNSSWLFTWCQVPYASCYTMLLYFARYCTIKLKMFSLFSVFVFYVLPVWKVL